MRAAIDAVVADAYGLSRDQYAHVLSTFSHKSYPKAPQLCLARFDELKSIGLEAFARKYDPYWDIPLNENLPQPVIDIPVPAEAAHNGGQQALSLPEVAAARMAAQKRPCPRCGTPMDKTNGGGRRAVPFYRCPNCGATSV